MNTQKQCSIIYKICRYAVLIKVLLNYNFTILIDTYVINYDIGMLKVTLDKIFRYIYVDMR